MADGAVVSRKKVSYFYQDDMNYYYGIHHPMKPFRLKLTHDLILSYRLYRHLRVLRPRPASAEEMMQFHSPEYIKFLQQVTPNNQKKLVSKKPYEPDMIKFGIGEQTDCPVFEDMFEFFQAYTGASLDAACELNRGNSDICINWSGGLHHAKKSESSGFCYVNDIVLAILELLKKHSRVLYIDIDIHHGDGVEEAFFASERVMTVSFHKHGDGFFPGTGGVENVGVNEGKYTSVNFPLKNGMDDDSYQRVFQPVIQEVMDVFRPGAIVLQCGADSLSGDRLCSVTGGCFNLTLNGHAECVRFVKSFGVPMLVLGGGGYTVRNVARCWVNETALLLDREIPDQIPPTCKYLRYFVPNFRLTLPAGNAQNRNTDSELEANKVQVLQNLRKLKGAPSVQMHTVPPSFAIQRAERQAAAADEQDPDVRGSRIDRDSHVAPSNEFFESDKDNAGEAGGATRKKITLPASVDLDKVESGPESSTTAETPVPHTDDGANRDAASSSIPEKDSSTGANSTASSAPSLQKTDAPNGATAKRKAEESEEQEDSVSNEQPQKQMRKEAPADTMNNEQ